MGRFFLVALVSFLSLAMGARSNVPTLTVYTYDAFTGPQTLGERMGQDSLKVTGCETRYVVFPSVGEALNQITLEGKKTRADVVVGVDQTLLDRAQQAGPFDPIVNISPPVEPGLAFDPSGQWVPFDYGFLALVYDSRRKNPPPNGISLSALATDKRFHKRIVWEDPRISSLGRSVLVWTRAVLPGAAFGQFWKGALDQALTVSPGWSAAYGMFLAGEADFVISYTTSPAYHIENEKHSNIRAVIFPEGNYRQVEAVGIRSASAQKACARKWVAHLVSPEIQTALPLMQWMYPARKGTALPESFRSLPLPAKIIDDPVLATSIAKEPLQEWTRLAAGIK